jgi:hypothetical protein
MYLRNVELAYGSSCTHNKQTAAAPAAAAAAEDIYAAFAVQSMQVITRASDN